MLIFGGSCTDPLTDEGQILCPREDPRYTLPRQISSRSVYSVAIWRRRTQNFAVFGLRHFVVSPLGSNLRKLNMSAELQTFPYPTAFKSFLYSSAFMAKSGAQTLTFKSVTNKRTDRQNATDRPGGRRNPSPTKLGMVKEIRGPPACSCTSKAFGIRRV